MSDAEFMGKIWDGMDDGTKSHLEKCSLICEVSEKYPHLSHSFIREKVFKQDYKLENFKRYEPRPALEIVGEYVR